MTTQAVTATVGSGMFSRTFSDTATDGQWTGNILTDSVANTNLGLVMPGQNIDHVQVNYSAGSCLWRIQSSQSLLVKRYGYASQSGYASWGASKIQPYTVAPDDILVVYPLALDTTIAEGTVLGWVRTTRGFEAFGAKDIQDGTATVIKTLVNNQTLGDYAFNASIQGITLQAEDGANITKVEIIDQTGGTIWSAVGGPRMPTAGGMNPFWNFEAMGLNIPILKGYTLKVTMAA